jgi:hypothetical protein
LTYHLQPKMVMVQNKHIFNFIQIILNDLQLSQFFPLKNWCRKLPSNEVWPSLWMEKTKHNPSILNLNRIIHNRPTLWSPKTSCPLHQLLLSTLYEQTFCFLILT